MTQFILRRIALTAVLALVMVWVVSTGTTAAEETGGLVPSFGDGKLTIIGSGFKAKEHVTITVEVGSTSREFSLIADAQGAFHIATDMVVAPGAGVKLDARGDKGTNMAAITSAPPAMTKPGSPSELPRTGSLGLFTALAVASGLVLAGGALVRTSGGRT